ncbi:kinesin-like protein Klp61F [Hyposmocoma kahamanoa]|uniref:kinesin-like protein Klp61F n=1 Tax=Hyposmocoma kahamanoa TaxID=1477025 RepID=UPI000E6D77B7|nr:kinesin-like protein Klp61F [Hyposmocoma kahamanoa]
MLRAGNTPARREFRYPRRLVATSPHDRILARFRAQQQDVHRSSPDSDCVVVESDIEYRHSSDSDEVSESEMSGDSAVAMQ